MGIISYVVCQEMLQQCFPKNGLDLVLVEQSRVCDRRRDSPVNTKSCTDFRLDLQEEMFTWYNGVFGREIESERFSVVQGSIRCLCRITCLDLEYRP